MDLEKKLNMNERKGEILVALALALRASSLLFGKIAMRTMGPYLTIAIRFTIAFILIAFLFRKSLHKVNFRTLWHCALIGFFFFLAMVFEMFGLQTTPSSVTAFLEGSVVVIVPAIACIMHRKLPDRVTVISAVVALIGVAFLTLKGDRLGFTTGELLVLGGTVWYSMTVIVTDTAAKNDDLEVVAVYQLLFIAIFAYIGAFIFEEIRGASLEKLLDDALSDGNIEEFIRLALEYRTRVGYHDDYPYADVDMTFQNSEAMDDMVLIKQDGMPTYNFANVIDDHLMGITHVMRGMEYLSSTPRYNFLYKAFGWEIPTYVHLTTVMRDAQHKLSKRDGDAYYSDFIEKGFLPESLINYLALVGWNPGDEREFFTLPELVDAFDIHRLNHSPGIFDVNKLTWFNAEYIRRLSPEKYLEMASPWFDKVLAGKGIDYARLAELTQPRTEVFNQLPEMVSFLAEMPDFDLELYTHKKMKTNPEVALASLQLVQPVLEKLPEWNETALHDAVMAAIQEAGLKNGAVLWPLRIAISGVANTPGGAFEIAGLLGREETLRRLSLSLSRLG